MPVHLDSHTPDINLTPGTTKSDIIVFLYNNLEFGYKPAEISNELDIPHGTATTTLSRLYNSDYVGKTTDGYYYGLDDQDEVHRYLSSLDQTRRMFGHHTDTDNTTPDTVAPDDQPTDAELEAELDDLEEDL